MKKAKFEDEFKMISGSCLAHYDEDNENCNKCKIFTVCKNMKERNIFPKSEEDVKRIIDENK